MFAAVLFAACDRSHGEEVPVRSRVWVVASTDPNELQATIDAALPGDEIRIGNPSVSYGLDRIAKGITIRGPGRVRAVESDIEPPANELVRLVDLRFESWSPTPWVNLFRLDVLAGRVAFDACRLYALRVRAGEVMLNATMVEIQGLIVDAAHVAAVDSSFHGSREYLATGPSEVSHPGIHLNAGARLHISRCSLDAVWMQPGLLVEDGARAWLADSTFLGGTDAPGIGNNSAEALRAARCEITAGSPNVQPIVGPVDESAPLLGIAIEPTFPASGATVAVRITGVPGDPVLLLASTALAVTAVSGFEQPQWLADPTTVIAQGAIGETAEVAFSVTLPNASVPLWLQAGGGGGVPHQFSPPAGGLVR